MDTLTESDRQAIDELRLLFGDDTEKFEQPPQNTIDVTWRIATIRQLEKQIKLLELQASEAKQFFASRVDRCEDRIGFLKQAIQGFLNHSNLKNLQTPQGTAYQRTITVKSWPEDAALLAWIDAVKLNAVRNKREPDKQAISAHIASTGEIPPGYSETQETRIYIK